ncbi:MAG: RHS repeat-associated core domain-containing protein, partial [Candidatus Omnitrophica bacterium]|nr:RHS repeat-associated core domain-containing protein [Candidatus Omnitrophota bacterium]
FFRALNLKERYVYDSFGTPTILGPGPDGVMDTADDTPIACSAYGNPYLFTGREYDCESGLYYYRSRYYDPRTGRFLQEDPVGFLGGVNFYTYASNNPIIFSDPLGLGPIKDKVAEDLRGKFGGHLSEEQIDRASTEFEKEAESTGRSGEIIGTSINPLISKKKKEEMLGKITKEILSSLKERAKNDPELRSLQEQLERVTREHELDQKYCPLGGSRNAQ